MEPKGLYAKIANVMAEVSAVPKNGRNKFHNYDYATESDVLNAIRPLMVEQGLVLIPMVEDVVTSASAGATDKSKAGHDITTVKMSFILADTETGESIRGAWYGQGQDTQDKGVYKAITGGHKYLLMKLFQIPTGDDPERSNGVAPDPPTRKAKPKPRKRTPEVEKLIADINMKTARLLGLEQAREDAGGEGEPLITDEQASRLTSALASNDPGRMTKAIAWLDSQTEKAKLTGAAT